MAESHVKNMIRGTCTLFQQASLSHVWWPYAPRCVLAIHYFTTDDDDSPLVTDTGGWGSPNDSDDESFDLWTEGIDFSHIGGQ